MGQLTQDEAMIAYRLLIEKTQKELKLAERRAVFGYLKGIMTDKILK